MTAAAAGQTQPRVAMLYPAAFGLTCLQKKVHWLEFPTRRGFSESNSFGMLRCRNEVPEFTEGAMWLVPQGFTARGKARHKALTLNSAKGLIKVTVSYA